MSLKLNRTTVLRKGSGEKPPDFCDHFFLKEIELQCEFGLRAFGEMQQAYKVDKSHPTLLVMSHILLVFAGNVAKLLAPSDSSTKKTIKRAKRLCKVLNLENKDFSNIRRARNYFEHFDERMDKYISSTEGLMIHRSILDEFPDNIEMDDGRVFQPKFLQFLDTKKIELTLYDEKFSLEPIVKKLEDIKKIVSEKLNEGKKETPND